MSVATMIAVSQNDISGSCAAVTKKTIDGKTYVSTTTVEQKSGKIYSRRLLLQGAIAAVKACDEPGLMKVFTNDEYLRMVVANYPSWEANGGMTKTVFDDRGEVVALPHRVYNYDLIRALSAAIHKAGVRLDVVKIDNIAPGVQKIADDLLTAVPAAEEAKDEAILDEESRMAVEAFNAMNDEYADELAKEAEQVDAPFCCCI